MLALTATSLIFSYVHTWPALYDLVVGGAVAAHCIGQLVLTAVVHWLLQSHLHLILPFLTLFFPRVVQRQN